MTPCTRIEAEVASASTLEASASALSKLLAGNFAVWKDGSLSNIKQLVARIGAYKIEIYAREHPPPHFHLTGPDVDATFSLVDGQQLEGTISRRDRDLVEWWYKRSRATLVRTWNETRPSGCPVGPIFEK